MFIHIALTDSGSKGTFANGDFHANKADFGSIKQLVNYTNVICEGNLNFSHKK